MWVRGGWPDDADGMVAVLSRRDAGRLTVRTVAVPDPGDLLAQLAQPDVVAWVQRGAGLVGWGEAARITLPAGEDRFTAAEKWLGSVFDAAVVDDRVRLRGSGPVAFGDVHLRRLIRRIGADRAAGRARP